MMKYEEGLREEIKHPTIKGVQMRVWAEDEFKDNGYSTICFDTIWCEIYTPEQIEEIAAWLLSSAKYFKSKYKFRETK